MVEASITYNVIGVIETPYSDKYDAPRQPCIDERVDQATVVLFPNMNMEQAIEDLDGCDRIWLIVHFHEITGWKPKILTPRDRKKRGVFATRSPHRPNAIGLSCVKLLSVEGRRLVVEGTDLLNGTPVLDIKPYLAYADAFPESRVRWLQEVTDQEPYIITNADVLGRLPEHIRAYILRTLSADPFPHPYRRIKRLADREYEIAMKEHRVRFMIEDKTVTIL